MNQPATLLLPLPFALPLTFAEQLGYRHNRRFVGTYSEPLGDEVTVCDDHSTVTGLGDRYAWSDFVHQRHVRIWLWDQNINLGNSDETATHWLIIDGVTNNGFTVPCDHGRHCIQQQRIADVE